MEKTGGEQWIYEEMFPKDFVWFANVDCSMWNDDDISELFQKLEAGAAMDMFGMTMPPSEPTDATSISSFLQDTHVPDLGKDAKKDSVKIVTFWDSRFQLSHFWILADAAIWESNQRASMLDLDSVRMTSKNLVELKRDSLSASTLRILVFWKLPDRR